MTTATAEPKTAPRKAEGPRHDFDPDSYRMTIGEHLEELRTRMVLGIIGFTIMGAGAYLATIRIRSLRIRRRPEASPSMGRAI